MYLETREGEESRGYTMSISPRQRFCFNSVSFISLMSPFEFQQCL